jgi:hypothetical protein
MTQVYVLGTYMSIPAKHECCFFRAGFEYNGYMAAKKEPVLIDVRAMARLGGKARAKSMTPEERSESARKAVQARWAKKGAKAPKKSGGKKT